MENTQFRITNRLNWLKFVIEGHTVHYERTQGDYLIRIISPFRKWNYAKQKHDSLLRKVKMNIIVNCLRNQHRIRPHLFSITESSHYEIYLNDFLLICLGLASESFKIFLKKIVFGFIAINTLTYSKSILNS